MAEVIKQRRPEIRNIHITQILRYRLPIAGVMSILHRVSGAVMFLMLPLLIYIFDLSLTSELSYATLAGVADWVLVKLVLVGLAWAFIHHAMGGVRHLINDMHVGISKEASPIMAWAFLAASLSLTAVAALAIFEVI